MHWPSHTSSTARRAQVRALSKLLLHAGSLVGGVGLGGLLVLRPLDWSFAWGVIAGAALYATGEFLIPYYAEPNDD